jgi:hypothetical protein
MYDMFEANNIPVGAPPAQAVMVDAEQATIVPAAVMVNPVAAVPQAVADDIQTQLVNKATQAPETNEYPVLQNKQVATVAEPTAAVVPVQTPPAQLVGAPVYVGATVAHVGTVETTPPHHPAAAVTPVHERATYLVGPAAGGVIEAEVQPAGHEVGRA